MALIIVLSIFSVGLLGLIVFFFRSKKSSPALKRAALGALVAIGLSLGICGFFIIRGPPAPEAELYLPAVVVDEAPVKRTGILGLLVFLVLLVGLLGVIIFTGMRDQNKKAVDKAIAEFDDTEQ